jgi:cell division septation protein DedD
MTALQAAATPTDIPEVVIPTSTPGVAEEVIAAPSPEPTSTPVPEPTTPPTPRPTATPATTDFFVQVLATSTRAAVGEARTKLEGLGFPRDNQILIRDEEAGEPVLFKLRVGPFPDRSSAERVSKRMSEAGFHGAWIVSP